MSHMSAAPLVPTIDFPLLVSDGVTYLDNAATSQKPRQVLDAIVNYYQTENANVHRGVHKLSDASTAAYEKARTTISHFFGAQPEELIFTRNTTEAINAVAYGWADHHLEEGDVIVTSMLEHHSNLVVWQQVCKRRGCRLELVAVSEDGQLDMADFRQKLKQHPVKLISLVHVSNAVGTVVPLSEVVALVHELYPATERPRIVVDGAQSAPHLPLNFANLGVDFFAFSGHKMLGPTGTGGLIVKKGILESQEMQPWLLGGGMIAEVYPQHTVFHPDIVDRFTAGTPDVAGAVGLAAACEYLTKIGMQQVLEHDQALVAYALEKLAQISEVTLVGQRDPALRVGSVAFLYQGVHAHDVAQVLDSQGVAVRSGHHCTMPLHLANNWVATTRASFQVYNSEDDIDALVSGLQKVQQVFHHV